MGDEVFNSVGHGGQDSGCVSPNGKYIEKNMALVYAKACYNELESNGVQAMLSRTDDRYISVDDLIKMSNASGARLHVAFHFNASGSHNGYGCEIYRSLNSTEGDKLANKIANRVQALGQEPHGQYVKVLESKINPGKDYYGELRDTNAYAVIIEPCFIDNDDVSLADTTEKLETLGKAVAHGIMDYLGMTVKPETEVIKKVEAKVDPKPDYSQDYVMPTDGNCTPLGNTGFWIEKAKDGRMIIHKSRNTYIAFSDEHCEVFTRLGSKQII